jgi:hypothetical protein
MGCKAGPESLDVGASPEAARMTGGGLAGRTGAATVFGGGSAGPVARAMVGRDCGASHGLLGAGGDAWYCTQMYSVDRDNSIGPTGSPAAGGS